MERFKNCTFCQGPASATITSTTPRDAFPFLCSQLGVKVPDGGGVMGEEEVKGRPPSLCSKCHNCWEEVTVLYSNMQGLVNLLGRRVEQLKKHVVTQDDLEGEDVTFAQEKMVENSNISNSKERPSSSTSKIFGWWFDPSSTSTATRVEVQHSINLPHQHPVNSCEEDVDIIRIKDELVNELEGEEEQEVEISQLFPNPPQSDNDDQDDIGPDLEFLHPSEKKGQIEGHDHSTSRPGRLRRHHQVQRPHHKPDESTNFELRRTQRGHPKIFASGYTYLFAKVGVGKKIWRCELHSIRCSARVYTTPDISKLLKYVGRHNHEPATKSSLSDSGVSANHV